MHSNAVAMFAGNLEPSYHHPLRKLLHRFHLQPAPIYHHDDHKSTAQSLTPCWLLSSASPSVMISAATGWPSPTIVHPAAAPLSSLQPSTARIFFFRWISNFIKKTISPKTSINDYKPYHRVKTSFTKATNKKQPKIFQQTNAFDRRKTWSSALEINRRPKHTKCARRHANVHKTLLEKPELSDDANDHCDWSLFSSRNIGTYWCSERWWWSICARSHFSSI